jgi:Tol biopolymer transport system component/predicted Ser/Thr protein kinase
MIERSQQIESLFREASQRNLAERDTWLHEACNGDSRLLLEVTSLLTNRQEGVRGEFRKAGSATLAAGWRMGPYEILAQIGAGGMGEVYRATDTRLRREVAIKVSAAQFNERFEREARVIASLNHPNICHLYDVGPNYLVMELVEGEDLSGPVPLETALNYARQMAEALESAHEKGIVHRDLKPANVKVTPAGVVKVLDFGLAKEAGQPSAAANTAGSPTLTMSPTRVGMILGTGAHMAPEQAQGKPVDKRADVWAFGCVLYELLTGKQPFHGETTSDTLASVLRDEPDWSRIPASVQPLLRCCLMKDPMHRLRDIGDAMPLLNRVPEPIPVKPLPWVLGTVLAIAVAIIGVVGWLRATRPLPAEQPLTRLSVDLGPDALAGINITVAISPDGRRLVFPVHGPNGKPQLATRLLDESQFKLLSNTENGFDPFFSPDGQWLGFFGGGKLKKISLQGGSPVALCAAVNPRGASWGEDDNIVVALNLLGPLSLVSAAGGTPRPLTMLRAGEASHRWPEFLPGGEAIVFTASPNAIGHEDANVEAISLKTGEVKVFKRGAYYGRYLPSGHLVYVHQGALFAVALDAAQLDLHGATVQLLEDLAANPLTGGGQFSFSTGSSGPGTFVYLAGKGAPQNWHLALLDGSGRMRSLKIPPGMYSLPRYSPDGRKLALAGDGPDIYVYDLERETTTRLTNGADAQSYSWTPDGKHIVFGSSSGRVSWIRSDGSGEAQQLLEGETDLAPWSFSPDGRWLACFGNAPETGSDIWIVPWDSTDPDHPKMGIPEPFLRTSADEVVPRFSPNGRWIAYRSNESGTNEIYVRPFAGEAGGKWQISAGGGLYALWSRNGRELFFETADRRIMALDYSVHGGVFAPGKPRPWSDRPNFYPGLSNLDLAPDGKAFAVLAASEAEGEEKRSVHFTMLENFFDELKRRVPAGGQ